MKNPGLHTINRFLTLLHDHAPVTYTQLSEKMSHVQVASYMKYSKARGLIVLVRTEQGRGKPAKFYSLTRLGQQLLCVLYEMEENLKSTDQKVKNNR